ncbi:MAG: VanZ family protein [Gammaproteobacteria bacterium]
MAKHVFNAVQFRALWLAAGYVLVAVIVYLSVAPSLDVNMQEGRDKIYHALAYGTLMLWFAQAYGYRRWWVIALASCALGVGLEYVQRWMGTRTFDYIDMLADAMGVAAGLMLAAFGINEAVSRIGALLEGEGRT